MKKKSFLLETIIEVIEKLNQEGKKNITKTNIANEVKSSVATVSKYIDILVAKGKLKTTNVGRYTLVEIKGEKNDE